ncbi:MULTISPECIES: DUF305 domain-containing protein [unclassified Solwaraspora]|uniref:DUF305 domain-containing protein n=1 Tax=unclassified Solwaraspora TaxID=2627926 RepID=UPI00248B1495|nr:MULTISPECIES: DUF305 domain-containing protein [unclassified Solwaraspora]WBB99440.1 DUF305 domain-containing protein [Solwaraspora sp. WMMA2059]WBC22010.1 DUF305 domain-containing protein [Solwaraspora sp. WMMA2080]WJK35943.1 DUF305 domain-containing protein [Solwaraspora sp. WMMA2065]
MSRLSLGRHRRLLALALIPAVVVVAVVVLRTTATTSATTNDAATGSAGTSTGTDAPPVILPGRPGEPAELRPGADVTIDPPQYNALDTWYVQMMIPHHTQAVQMAALAADRSADPGVRAFADRIRAGQAAEIAVLRQWLQDRRLPAGEHDHDTMPGMQTEQAVRELAAARGAEFDRLFVAMMTDHHQGAVEMSDRVLTGGSDVTVEELATSIAAEQAVEINRMRDLLDS